MSETRRTVKIQQNDNYSVWFYCMVCLFEGSLYCDLSNFIFLSPGIYRYALTPTTFIRGEVS